MRNVTYDPKVKAAYLQLRDSKIIDSEEVAPGIIFDFDEEGSVVGIEILDVDKKTPEQFKQLSSNTQYPLTAEEKVKLQEFFSQKSYASQDI